MEATNPIGSDVGYVSFSYRRHYLWYYSCKSKIQRVCIPIFIALLVVFCGGAIGAFIGHIIVCNISHQDFRHFCGKKESDIIVSSFAAVTGSMVGYGLWKTQLWSRCKCICGL